MAKNETGQKRPRRHGVRISSGVGRGHERGKRRRPKCC